MFNFIKDILFPKECLSCKTPSDWLCSDCLKLIKFNSSQKVNNKNLILDEIFIAGDYENKILATLIKKFKYNFIKDIGLILGQFLCTFLQTKPEFNPLFNLKTKNNNFLVIPVPLAKKRKKWRGFNQAEILGKIIATNFNWKYTEDLKRKKFTPPQAELSEAERLNNLNGAFKWAGKDLSNYQIILIDDVATTGSTLNECALAIKSHNPEKIFGLVIAKG